MLFKYFFFSSSSQLMFFFFLKAFHKKHLMLYHFSKSLLCEAQGLQEGKSRKTGGVLCRQGASAAMQGTLHLTEVLQSLAPFLSFFFLRSGVFADCSCKCSQFLCQHFALLYLHQHGVHQQACRGDLGRERERGKEKKSCQKEERGFFPLPFLTPDSFSGVSLALMTTLTCDETQDFTLIIMTRNKFKEQVTKAFLILWKPAEHISSNSKWDCFEVWFCCHATQGLSPLLAMQGTRKGC